MKEYYKNTIIFGLIGTFTIPWIFSVCHVDMRWMWSLGVLYPIVFACAGYLIKNYSFSISIEISIYVVGLLSFVGIIVGTYFVSLNQGMCFDSNARPPFYVDLFVW